MNYNVNENSTSDILIKYLYKKNIDIDEYKKIIEGYGNEISKNEELELEKTIQVYYFNNPNDMENININLENLLIEFRDGIENEILNKVHNYLSKVDFFFKSYEKRYNFLNETANEKIKELDSKIDESKKELENLKHKNKKLQKQILEADKKSLEKIGIFIAIFTLVAGNVSI